MYLSFHKILWFLRWMITSHRSTKPVIRNVYLLYTLQRSNQSLQSKFLKIVKLCQLNGKQFVLMLYTFRLLDHIHTVYKSAQCRGGGKNVFSITWKYYVFSEDFFRENMIIPFTRMVSMEIE